MKFFGMEIGGSHEREELGKARAQSAREAVEQARTELANATTDADRAIWQNRLVQRQAELERLEADSGETMDKAA